MSRRTARALVHHARPPSAAPAVARFITVFAALLVAMEIVYHAAIMPLPTSNLLNRTNTALAGGLLRLSGRDVYRDGVMLAADGGPAIQVQWGCDGLEPIGILLAGLGAFPCVRRRKYIGAAIAIPVLLVLNVVRVSTLALASAHWRAGFEMLHMEIWPAMLILAAVVLWIACAAWQPRGGQSEVGRAAA